MEIRKVLVMLCGLVLMLVIGGFGSLTIAKWVVRSLDLDVGNVGSVI